MNSWVMFQAYFKVFPSITTRMPDLLYVSRMLLGSVVAVSGVRNEGTHHNMAMKVTARKLLLALYLAAGVVAISALFKPYGGWRGNLDSEHLSHDTPSGYVFFNRW